MTVKLLYFGKLKDHLKRSEDEWNLTEALTVEQILCQVLHDDPNIKAWQNEILYAVNLEQVSGDFVVHDGDEVAFMPPMAGG